MSRRGETRMLRESVLTGLALAGVLIGGLFWARSHPTHTRQDAPCTRSGAHPVTIPESSIRAPMP